MPRKRLCVLLAMPAWLAPAALLAASAAVSPNMEPAAEEPRSYTVQSGDTLTSIARKYGLPLDSLIKANDLEKPHRITAGHILRLPVSPPEAAPAKAPDTAEPAQHAKDGENAPGPRRTPVSLTTAASVEPPAKPSPAPGTGPAGLGASTGAAAQAKAPETPETTDDTGSLSRLAAGVYSNPVMGTLRVTQTPTGIAVTRDNHTIPMRHLLYGVFDGADATGLVHGLRLEFDAAGQVRAVLYNSGGSLDVPFNRLRK